MKQVYLFFFFKIYALELQIYKMNPSLEIKKRFLKTSKYWDIFTILLKETVVC